MEIRSIGPIDRLIGEIDKAIKVLSVPARTVRAVAAQAVATPPLSEPERLLSTRLLRVDHAGEVAAQALYQGQALTARSPAIRAAMRHGAAEEHDHLAWCQQRLTELGGRTSIFNPIWYAGSFAIGCLAGLIGDRTSLGFITETETQVEAHLRDHLQRLPPNDLQSRAILQQMSHEEVAHGGTARALGGSQLPALIRAAMRRSSKVMTRASYWC